MVVRDRLRSMLVASAIASVGCSAPGITAEQSSETGDGGGCQLHPGCSECSSPALLPHGLDILVIVDGSIGSAAAQSRLAAGLDQLIAELDAAQYPIDWRIAVTTTDMGPPACDPIVTTPEHGRFVSSSCRERLGDFVDSTGQDFTTTCTDACSLAQLERLPTWVEGQAEPAVRAWIENDGGQSNLAAGVDLAEATRCMAMVGVAGCRFESPLAAIEAALLGSNDPGSPNYGFFRSLSRRAYVLVTDGADCSWTDVGLPIFDPEGERAFWSDPLADAPTPAVCWNAGTKCTGAGEGLDCVPSYYNVHGDPSGLPEQRVLEHTSHFSDSIKSAGGWDRDFVLIAGLNLDGELEFTGVGDPEFVSEHGTGPACDDQAGTAAVAPVRVWEVMRELASYYDPDLEGHTASICAPDFGPPLIALGQRMRAELDRPSCYSHVLCDADPSTELLDVECELTAYAPGPGSFDVPECARGEDGAYLVDPDTGRAVIPDPQAELCWLARVDAHGLTADPLDDAWPECVENDLALGFEIVSRDGRSTDDWIETLCVEPTG